MDVIRQSASLGCSSLMALRFWHDLKMRLIENALRQRMNQDQTGNHERLTAQTYSAPNMSLGPMRDRDAIPICSNHHRSGGVGGPNTGLNKCLLFHRTFKNPPLMSLRMLSLESRRRKPSHKKPGDIVWTRGCFRSTSECVKLLAGLVVSYQMVTTYIIPVMSVYTKDTITIESR